MISEECKDLIAHLLVVDPKKRFTSEQALKHQWFKIQENRKDTHIAPQFDEDVILRLRTYRGESLFKRAAMNMLVKMATNKDVKNLREEFEKMDKDQTGMITHSELKEVLKSQKTKLTDEEVRNIIQQVDYQAN